MWNSIFTVTPINSDTNKWLERNISTRSIITKNGFLISHHFIEDILESLYYQGMEEDKDYSIDY